MGYHYIFEKLINLDNHERLMGAVEVAVLTEALKTSYKEATKVLLTKQKISKSIVYEKVHGLEAEMPEKRKVCAYLNIEADEEHATEQHGSWSKETMVLYQNSFIYMR